jgi:4-alpha-glucanotransferase
MAGAEIDGLSKIRFSREICGDLAAAERANGGSATAWAPMPPAPSLSLSHRYHALLVGPIDPPLGAGCLVLAKADAELVLGDRRWPLLTNRWAVAQSPLKAISHSQVCPSLTLLGRS